MCRQELTETLWRKLPTLWTVPETMWHRIQAILPHEKQPGEDSLPGIGEPVYPARRWKVERSMEQIPIKRLF